MAGAFLNPKTRGPIDRGDFLECAFDDRLLGYERRKRSLTSGEVFVSPEDKERKPLVPLWVANATVFANGSVFPFHPQGMERYQIVGCTHRLGKLKAGSNDLPLAVAMKASASFPTLIPATTLESSFDPDKRFLHLFDGGLSDNLGIYTALNMLAKTQPKPKLLIVIDAYKGNPDCPSPNPRTRQIFPRSECAPLQSPWTPGISDIARQFIN